MGFLVTRGIMGAIYPPSFCLTKAYRGFDIINCLRFGESYGILTTTVDTCFDFDTRNGIRL